MFEKSKTYKLLERFHNESIGALKDALNKEKREDRVGDIKDRIAFYEELYNVMFRMAYSHTAFVTKTRLFHKRMVELGVYKLDDEGNSHIDLDVIEDEFADAYKGIEYLYNYYQDCKEGLVSVDETLKAIKLFQDALGTVVVE